MNTPNGYSDISGFTREFLVALDESGEIAYASAAFVDRFIGPGREAKGRAFSSLLHADDQVSFEAVRKEVASGLTRRFFEGRCLTVGGWRWFRWELMMSRDAGEEKGVMELAGRDSTREKFREEQLFKLSQAVEQNPVAIAMTDLEGYVQYANSKYMDAVGYTLEEILDQKVRILSTAELSQSEWKKLWETLAKGHAWSREVRDRRSDGNDCWFSVRIAPITEGSGKANQLLVLLDDITERKALEARIRETQKMENLGTLAGGIAHDFKNLLAIINGYCTLAQDAVGGDEPAASHLAHAQAAVSRAVALVQRILTFSRTSESSMQPVQLNRVVKDLFEIASETFPRTIEFHLRMDNALPLINGDSNQLHQALLNAAVNARDGMDGAGTLVIRTFQVKPNELPAHALKASAAAYVAVSISDTGIGMDEETRRRIFEPFFTTKEIGKGTGLGLSVVHGIVQNHNGYVDVQSVSGEGTTFTFFFPATEEGEEDKPARKSARPPVTEGEGEQPGACRTNCSGAASRQGDLS